MEGDLTRHPNAPKIVNRVAPSIYTGSKKKAIAGLLHKLLVVATKRGGSSEIVVGAKKFNTLTLVQIKHEDIVAEFPIEKDIADAAMIAATLGGCVYISGRESGETTVTFTYLNNDAA